MGSWLQHASASMREVADRPELWIPGSLAWIAYGGMLLFLGAVVPFPSLIDLGFFGARLAVSGSPLPALALGGGLLAGLLLLMALHAFGESVLAAGLRRGSAALHGLGPLLGVHLVAAVPVTAAGLLLATRLAAVAPAEYQSPDIGGPLLLRVAGAVLPELILLAVALVAVQTVAAVAAWLVLGRDAPALGRAISAGITETARSPLPLGGVAIATLVAHVAYGALAFALLRVLWAPIGAALAAGELRDVVIPVLLVGFVAIWLCLVLGGGALHAWASAWWALELEAGRRFAAAAARSDGSSEAETRQGAGI